MGKYESFNENPFSVHQKICGLVKEGNVLDVGCAEGNLSKMMKKSGCKVFGIEINNNSAEIAKKYCSDVFIGDVERIVLTNEYEGYFDFIIFADVLEHLKEPLEVLMRFKKYLKDEGHVVISLPNISNWRIRLQMLLGKMEYENYGIMDEGHLRFFNEQSAKKLLYDAGFQIESFDLTVGDVKYFPKLFYKLGLLLPNLLAFQFLIMGEKI